MSALREAAEMALKALEEINKLSVGEKAICLPGEIDGVMEALRQALAQPVDAVNISQERVDKTAKREHEPVAWMCEDPHHIGQCVTIYKTPPKREWVGLTGLEQKELMAMNSRYAVFETEAKLKEKNT